MRYYGKIKNLGIITSKPVVVYAEITLLKPYEVKIVFDQNIDPTQIPATTAFTLIGKTISNVSIVGTDVILTITTQYDYGDVVTLSYNKPLLNPLIGLIGSWEVDTFLNQTVINNTDNVVPLWDGDTLGWYDAFDLSTITEVGGITSRWNDKIGGGKDFVIGSCGWSAINGMTFNGINQYLKTNPFASNQPQVYYFVFNQVSWTSADVIFDGETNSKHQCAQDGVSPGLTFYAGSAKNDTRFVLGSFCIMKIVWYAGSSKICYNDSCVNTNLGSDAMDGLILGRRATAAIRFGNFYLKEFIIRTKIDTSSDHTIINDYLKAKHGL